MGEGAFPPGGSVFDDFINGREARGMLIQASTLTLCICPRRPGVSVN